jgi:hypothetical protein
VEIPLRYGELCRHLHPVSLRFVVSKHGRLAVTCEVVHVSIRARVS